MPGFTLPGCELGVATAATQIEGGELDTNWHRWAASGHIADGSSPARAADHWNRVAKDIALLEELGVRHYRMGIEWARVEPEPGRFDTAAIDHYRDELTGLHAAGISPLVTLQHFNLPGWAVDAGGWLAPHARSVFLRFVRRVVTDFSDLVTDWVTINEPNVYASEGYLRGTWPPGQRSLRGALAIIQVLAEAHIAAYQLIHQLQPEARVGVAHHLRVFEPLSWWHPGHHVAAAAAEYLFQTLIVDATSVGRFRPPLRRPRWVRPGRYYDFQGVNYYARSSVTQLSDGTAPGTAVNDLGWEIHPEGLVDLAAWVHRRHPGPIWITENGTADAADAFRARYLYDHLGGIARSGLPVERYYHWCFTDNWEWADGEVPRFGLVHLDYETQQRTLKDSGRFYADMIANGGVTEAAYQRWVAGQWYPTSGASR